jgi:hypothetical protein
MGPEGLEPPPPGLKGRCAAVTPRPRLSSVRGMRLLRADISVPSFTTNDGLTNVRESGRPDSNRRSQAPRACGLARLSHALGGCGRSPTSGGRDLARGSAAAKREGPVVATPGLETPRGVRDRPGVNSAGHGADADSPNNRRAAWRIGRSGLVSDTRRSSQSRPLWTISGRFDRSRRRLIRGPAGRHRRVLYQMDAGPVRDVRAHLGFFSGVASARPVTR